ncbi:MAG TPA: GNAT family N-acetyltransferase [Anaerolineales bacterium]|nr:GNAT family N-acetyltransferase [Anaerolineales bacterium]
MNVALEKQIILSLPGGYSARGGKLEDYKITFDLLNTYARYLHGRDDLVDPELLRLDWQNDGFNPGTDLRMIFAPDGSLVAFVECWLNQEPPVHPWIYGCVHPDHWGLGIGGHILTWAEDHARSALEKCVPDLRVAPRSGTEAHNKTGIALFEQMGWKHIRSYFRMVVDLDSAPDVAEFPDGIVVRPYDPDLEIEEVYRTFVDTFKDHFGFVLPPFEKGLADFKHNLIHEPGYDPRFWFVAMDGQEMAGICICRREDPEDPESGWVSELGVRRTWRKRGLGYALLKHAFAAFHTDGKKRAGLGVDANSLTGALKLYERAGMRVLRQFNQYEKEMRPGRELAVESI